MRRRTRSIALVLSLALLAALAIPAVAAQPKVPGSYLARTAKNGLIQFFINNQRKITSVVTVWGCKGHSATHRADTGIVRHPVPIKSDGSFRFKYRRVIQRNLPREPDVTVTLSGRFSTSRKAKVTIKVAPQRCAGQTFKNRTATGPITEG